MRAGLATLPFVLLLLASPVRAQWIPDGALVCIAPDDQAVFGVTPDGVGGTYVVFRDRSRGGCIQHLTIAGTIEPGWPAAGIPLGPMTLGPLIQPDSAGGALICWFNNETAYAQRVLSDGSIAAGWPSDGKVIWTLTSGRIYQFVAVADGAGGLFAAWAYYFDFCEKVCQSYSTAEVHHVLGNGDIAAGWPVRLGGLWHHTILVDLVADDVGGLFVSHRLDDNVYLQRRNSLGTSLWDVWVGTQASYWLGASMLTSDGVGGVFVGWSEEFENRNVRIMVQRMTSAGAASPGWPAGGQRLTSEPGPQYSAKLVKSSDGILVVWTDYRAGNMNVYALRMTSGGSTSPGWPTDGFPVCASPGHQTSPSAVPDGSGGAFVAWEHDQNGVSDIYGTRITASGEFAPGWAPGGTALCTAPSSQYSSTLAADLAGGAVVAWTDARLGWNQLDVYAQRMWSDGPVPVLVSLASVDATPDRVRIEWAIAEPTAAAVVERRTESPEWAAMATATATADRLLFEDRDVEAGQRYAYRIRVGTGEGALVSEATWVDVPAWPRLALRVMGPNPTSDPPRVRFTLPAPGAARLDVLDVSGRLVSSHDATALEAGPKELVLRELEAAPAGVYVLRLRAGREVVTARAIVVR